MNKLLAFIFTLSGCASLSLAPLDLPGIPAELDPTLALITQNGGAGHACPVEGFVITAHHVIYDERDKSHVNAAWSDGRGQEGFAAFVTEHPALDLAVLQAIGGTPSYLPRGEVKVGETVYWWEYDFRTRANALRARRRFAKVLRVVAQGIVLDETPVPGASGSCLVNEKGEVIGIINRLWFTEDGLNAGNAVKLPELPQREEQ